jgi:hypothetical protein
MTEQISFISRGNMGGTETNIFFLFLRCLDDMGWEYQRAALVFTELNKQGTIPREAFIK